MTRTLKDVELSERLRTLISRKFSDRGRFRLLEEASDISASRWKNFFYKKQEATPELVKFWVEKFPSDAVWLTTGVESPNKEGFPFMAEPPRRSDGQTIGERLNWVIAEWAAPKNDALFSYLEERSYGRIPADDWKKVILRLSEPSAEMVGVICSARPMFAMWVVLGYVASGMNVDPTSAESIEEYKRQMNM